MVLADDEGIPPGMPLAEAKSLSGEARFERHDPSADADALWALALECRRFSPLVGLGEEGALLMDVTGCAHLFGGEAPLAREVATFAGRRGLVSRVSLAGTSGAAWGVCRYGRGGVIPPGGEEAALERLSVAALRLSLPVVETLAELGIRTIGPLRTLPRGSLAARFGAEVAVRMDQALGRVPEPIIPVRDLEPVQAEWDFDEPVTDRRSLETVLRQLIERIAEDLDERQAGVQRLECRINDLFFTIGTSGPTAAVPHLWELLRLRLERMSLPREVTHVALRAALTARRGARQRLIVPDDQVDQQELRLLLDRLGNRLGESAVVRPQPVPDHLPELACRFAAVANEPAASETVHSAGQFRPVRLHPEPLPVEVISLIPEGPPLRFRWKGEDHTIVQHWGPERIGSGWWRGRQVRRDYYRVETTTGRRFWLFRAEETWFLHGTFE